MPYPPNTQIGVFKISRLLGSGAFGDVYLAKDARLHRRVALKILRAPMDADSISLRRFRDEGRAAAALSHPNIVGIYDVGEFDGLPFIVSEFVEGRTLRLKLADDGLSLSQILDYVGQIADGLGAAHAVGIVHRDIKPENIVIGNDGRLKILDFGIAKLFVTRDPEDCQTRMTATRTRAGAIVGTLPYMSPEQLRGLPVDHRSDVFSFGVVIHEMVCGQRPFTGTAPENTTAAILNSEPPKWPDTLPPIFRHLELIARRCLEKTAEERFQSAKDVKFAVQASFAHGASEGLEPAGSREAPLVRERLAARPPRSALSSPLVWQRLTFGRGTIQAARFAPDGQTVVYSAAWNGGPLRLYMTRPGRPESHVFGPGDLAGTDLLAISHTGELAISLERKGVGFVRTGVLARLPFAGGAPRQLQTEIQEADWAAPADTFAVVRRTPQGSALEFPLGRVVYEAPLITAVRVSRDRKNVAFAVHESKFDDKGQVAIWRNGRSSLLLRPWSSVRGLAWSPDGTEIWFTAADHSERALHAVTLHGRLRTLARFPGSLTLFDVFTDGRVLLAHEKSSQSIVAEHARSNKQIDLTWLDGSLARGLSADGRALLFDESGEGGGDKYSVYVRALTGDDPVRLSDGLGIALSPDGKSAIVAPRSRTPPLFLVPVGPGNALTLKAGALTRYLSAAWLGDPKRFVVCGAVGDNPLRLYTQTISGLPKPMSPVGVIGPAAVSPDGKLVVGIDESRHVVLCSVDGTKSKVITDLGTTFIPIQWSADGRALYLRPRGGALPLPITRFDLLTRKRATVRSLTVADPAGVAGGSEALMTRDARTYVFSYMRTLSDLYMLTGVH